MGHSRRTSVRAWKNKGSIDFEAVKKVTAKQLDATAMHEMGITSVDELCWVCESCGHRNGCTETCNVAERRFLSREYNAIDSVSIRFHGGKQ